MVNKIIGFPVKKVLAPKLVLPFAMLENFSIFLSLDISVSSCKVGMMEFTYVIEMLWKLSYIAADMLIIITSIINPKKEISYCYY